MITTLRHDQLDMPTQIFGDVLTNCLEDVWHQKLQSHENLWDFFPQLLGIDGMFKWGTLGLVWSSLWTWEGLK